MGDRNIDFIARHYRRGLFAADAGLRRLGLVRTSVWSRFRVAAAVAALVVLSATAAIIYKVYVPAEVVPAEVAAVPESPLTVVKVIDFEDATLTQVVTSIEEIYGVEVGNLPANPDAYTLSLHYEGNPADLIGVINEITGAQLIVTKK